jgi:uncharacterized circularly permuted ATP-grasp superfamily protein/uncharacterized alpha-E superfamily protein
MQHERVPVNAIDERARPPPAPDSLDEMVDGNGRFRPHWHRVLEPVFGLGHDGLAERARLLQGASAEEGFASLLPGARSVVWHCDAIPMPLPAAEFAELESALIQRAQLLEAILADLYGPQTLLADGTLPASLVYANPAFLRACRRTGPGEDVGPLLQFYAADLVRGPDGAWRVLADRTGAPSGAAYALENRRMLSRIFPELFRSQEIWPLAPFFESWQAGLQRLAPAGRTDPSIALLTPGHKDPSWFEHVLLSRELSCALVEGGDLTVRNGRVFLKTLRGLQPVDVLLRRQNGLTVDPLELGFRPVAGVTGLLEAARLRTVRIVNDPGTELAEAPALAAFLPDLAPRLLGERLRLPSVPVRWLGDTAIREAVLGSLSEWLIRPALDGAAAPIAAAALSATERQALAGRIGDSPWRFAATAAIPPSVVPSIGVTGIEPRRVILRLFLLFDGTRWQAMRGGLARTLSAEDVLAGPLPRQALAKDVWVLVEDDGAQIASDGFVPVPPLPIRRGGDLPARVAGDFFWLGRHLERLEAAARLQRAALARLGQSAPMPRERAELHVLTMSLVHTGMVSAELAQNASAAMMQEALLRTIADEGPLPTLLDELAQLAEKLRDRLTGEMYAVITQSMREIGEEFRAAAGAGDGRRMELLSQAMGAVLRFAATVAGLAAENMVRSGGLQFLDLGRRLERAEAAAAEVAFALAPQGAATQPGHIEAGLRLALELRDSAITYRNRYPTVVQPAPALDLVLADEDNPRALAFQLARARDLLADTDGEAGAALAAVAATLLDEIQAMVGEVARSENQAVAAMRLPERLRAVGERVAGLSHRIARQYFELLPVAHAVDVGTDAPDMRRVA